MRGLPGSLPFRIGLIFVLGMGAMQIAILLAAIWPDGRPLVYRLVDPSDARELAEVLERAPPDLRQPIARAASGGGTTVKLFEAGTDLAGAPEGPRPAPPLEARYSRYAAELGGRPVEIQVRASGRLARIRRPNDPPRGPMRVIVHLRTGELLVIERMPIVLHLLASRYLVVAIVSAAVLALLVLVLYWQVVRPLGRLARATESLGGDLAGPDVNVGGARELRALGQQFNAMKRRIGDLVADRTRMLAAIAHDMRTYLTRLRLRAEHIADEGQRRRAVADVEEMSLLLDDVLLFARKDARDGDEPERAICAAEEAEDYIALRREAGDPVRLSVAGPGLPCACGRLAFRRILGNLVDNAIRYGGSAQVHLAAAQGGAAIALTVSDEGPGIAEDRIGRMADPFERGEESRGRHSGGAGLGLSIVKALAESHGGTLTLENRSGGGLSAVVHLPAAGGMTKG